MSSVPYKDRARHLAYLAAYRAKHRPSPEAQSRSGLPPMGAMKYSEDGTKVRCHACGRWFGALNTHLRMHDLDQASYKEAYGLKRTASLLPPATADKYRAATVARDQGGTYRDRLPHDGGGRPAGQDARLQTRVEASVPRRGKNMRAGAKIR